MPKIILTAQVEDGAKWEAGFRTHGDLFRTYGLQAPIQFGVAGHDVALLMEPKDMDVYMAAMHSQATVEGMSFDGVKRETVKIFVLDKEVKL